MERVRKDEMELCLCAVCAGYFYRIPSYRIVRKHLEQKIKEPCTFCGCRPGYDYMVFSNVKCANSHVGKRDRK